MACSNVMRRKHVAYVAPVRGAVERHLADGPLHSRPTRFAGYLICVALTSLITGRSSPLAANDGIEFFEQRIRPMLVEHCYECHSAQAVRSKELKGGLRLDSRELIRRGGETGPAVVPGSIEDSLLVTALRHQDGLEMPPQGRLPDRIVNDFVHWISSGAADPRKNESESTRDEDHPLSVVPQTSGGHWAFQPPRPSPAPDGYHGKSCKTVWDSFILAELDKRGLAPVRGATKRELIRRVTFDLIGVPPTVAEVDTFQQDESPGAFGKVVDRLLASPHYGERWGRFWLDVARYADDKALAYHNPWPHAYRYRDWVVRALNNDMPYDRFVRLQLAGDLLPEPVTEYTTRLAGLGFQGLGALYHKGSVPEQVKADELDDRIDTLSRGLLGLTVACARCHDHKYDPISTQDYYSLAAAYNGATWTEVAMAAPEVIAPYKAWEQDQKRVAAELDKWLNKQGRRISRRELDRVDRYLLTAWRVHAHRQLGVPIDESVIAKQEELQAFYLSRCGQLLDQVDREKTVPALANWIRVAREAIPRVELIRRQRATANLTNKVDEELFSVTTRLRSATNNLVSQLHAVLQHHDRLTRAANERESETDGNHDKDKDPNPKLASRDEALLKAVWLGNKAPFRVTEKDVPQLLDAEQRAEHVKRQADVARHKRSAPLKPPVAHGVSGGGAPMRISIRGNVERPGGLAPPGFLPVLQSAGDDRPARDAFTRLDLADAICAPGNPLTARVIVNRVWQHHFGRGIVATASNFGQLGEPPSHPELLDTLAVRFMESGWSLKWLHRQIVGSAAYQRSSGSAYSDETFTDVGPTCEPQTVERHSSLADASHDVPLATTSTLNSPDPRSIDPDNRLLWRFTPRRLDVEAWRDAILAVSGRLDRAIGGPAGGGADTDHVRRTVYSTISRREPNKMLVAFDFPDANVTSERRDVTTVPQQQLFVLNSPFILQSARDLATRTSMAADDDHQRIQWIYRLAFARRPTTEELRDGQEFLAAARNDLGEDQLTEWEQFAQAILAANEFSWID